MANYLTTIEFVDEESMRTLLVAAKLHFNDTDWKAHTRYIFVDESELTVWTEWEDQEAADFWKFWEFDFDIDIEWSEIELGFYSEDVCTQHYTSTAVDANVEFPQFEFEINFINTKLDKFLSNVRQEDAA